MISSAGGARRARAARAPFDAHEILVVAGRVATRSIRSTARVRKLPGESALTDEATAIRTRLERGEGPPLAPNLTGQIAVFISGHTHAPSLTAFSGWGVHVNSGCWLRQLHPVPAHLGAPSVFISRFVQTHVRVFRTTAGLEVELWEHPRPTRQRLLAVERLAILGRVPAEPAGSEKPRVRNLSVGRRGPASRLSSSS